MKNGFFQRWGKTLADDPKYSPFGPEIADIEITSICNYGCDYCYKSNTSKGTNMSLDTFSMIIDKLPNTMTQVAFGADAGAETNPDLWAMADYCRSKKIVPNITVADVSDETAVKLSQVMGAVAVSFHGDFDTCYNNIKKLTDLGMTQINAHFVIHENSFEEALRFLSDMKSDSRLEKMYAIVFLSIKQKGRAQTGFQPLSQNKFNQLIDKAREVGVNYGFDSCGSSKFSTYLNSAKISQEEKIRLETMIEPCESFGLFSSYFSVDGEYFPCSFAKGCRGWTQGVDMRNVDNFVEQVWNGSVINQFREESLGCNRECLFYKI
jgi:sulfatase maturation enzyme AslB (radical SAM superfamily)